MKNSKLIFALIFTGAFLLFLIPAKAQTTLTTGTAALSELVIGVPKITEKTLFTLTEAIKTIEGAEYVMFCPEHNLILIKYNPSIFQKKEDVLKAIENKDVKLPMFIKEGTFEGVKDMCGN
ncbi:MAG: hypothetical protein V1904_02870 [Bacteroidota bacterium]